MAAFLVPKREFGNQEGCWVERGLISDQALLPKSSSPAGNASTQAKDAGLLPTVIDQKGGSTEAGVTMPTLKNHIFIFRNLLKSHRDFLDEDMGSAWNVARLVFPNLAHVNYYQIIPLIQPGFEIVG